MVRKIFKTGNSFVITISKETLERLGLQEGSQVVVTVDPDQDSIVIKPVRPTLAQIEPGFAQQLDEFIEQYRPALEALAK